MSTDVVVDTMSGAGNVPLSALASTALVVGSRIWRSIGKPPGKGPAGLVAVMKPSRVIPLSGKTGFPEGSVGTGLRQSVSDVTVRTPSGLTRTLIVPPRKWLASAIEQAKRPRTTAVETAKVLRTDLIGFPPSCRGNQSPDVTDRRDELESPLVARWPAAPNPRGVDKNYREVGISTTNLIFFGLLRKNAEEPEAPHH